MIGVMTTMMLMRMIMMTIYFLADINECSQNSSLCRFVCKNFIGGYRCQCPAGFRGDGRTCKGA